MYGPYSQPRGPLAARLRQRKAQLLSRFSIPDDLLPGSLSVSHPRCGRSGCHCAKPNDPGHPTWTLTYMVGGKKRTMHVPKDWVEDIDTHVQAGREFLDAVREVLAANAQLLDLARKQRLLKP